MNYQDWQKTVSEEITKDPLWTLEAYKMGLFISEIGWHDVKELNKNSLTRPLANQLIRALDSISANIAEGYSRSTGKDRARFYEYSLGSARESRDWYYKARRILREEVVEHRMALLTQIIKMLNALVPKQRQKGIREEQANYENFSQDLTTNIPMP